MGVGGPRWTAIEDAQIRIAAASGLSASACAAKMNGRPRLAVLGRAHRLGIKFGGRAGVSSEWGWTAEDDRRLRILLLNFKTKAQIAAILGRGCTVNIVTGRMRRLKLQAGHRPNGRRTDKAPPKGCSGFSISPWRQSGANSTPPKKTEGDIFAGPSIPRIEAGNYSCLWPIGDERVGHGPHHPRCCGAQRFPGVDYCEAHARMAYRNFDHIAARAAAASIGAGKAAAL